MDNLTLSGPLAQSVGWALVHFLWQGALIAIATAAVLALLRAARPAVRYVVACAGLALMLATPVASIIAAAAGRGPQVAEDRLIAAIAAPVTPVARIPARISRGVAVPARIQVERVLPVAVSLWVAGVLLLSIRLISAWYHVERLKQRGTRPVSDAVQARVLALSHRLRIGVPVRTIESALVAVPTVVGWFRPVILLPASVLAGLPAAHLEAVLAHELAHVRRHDFLVNALQAVVETLLFYHPAVWWCSRQIRMEREHCCDDLAVAACGDRVAYATALADLEELRGATVPLALAISGGRLVDRVRRLLGVPSSHDGRSRIWPALVTLSLVLLLAAAGGTLAGAVPQRAAGPEPGVPGRGQDGSAPSRNPGDARGIPDAARTDFEAALADHAAAVADQEAALVEWNADQAEYQAALVEQSAALAEWNIAQADLDAARATWEALQADGGAAIPDLKAVQAEVTSALADLMAARAELEEIRDAVLADDQKLVSWRDRIVLHDEVIRAAADLGLAAEQLDRLPRAPRAPTPSTPATPPTPPTPVTPPTPATPPTPPTPPSRDGNATWSDQFGRMSLSHDGMIVLADDDMDVVSISPGGYLKVVETRGRLPIVLYDWFGVGSGQRIELRGRADGSIERMYASGGRVRPFEPEGRLWLRELLPRLVRRTGFAADSRIARIKNREGVAGVVAEVGRLESDFVRGIYLRALAKERLSPDDLVRVLRSAQSIGSDYELAGVLIRVGELQSLDAVTAGPFEEAIGRVGSDYEHRRVLSALVTRTGDGPAIRALLRSAATIGSDYELAEFLNDAAAASFAERSPQAFFDAVAAIGSDYERRRTLSAVVEQPGVAPATLEGVLRSAAGMGSDYERATLLVDVAGRHRLEGTSREAYVAAAEGIGSDYEQSRALVALVRSERAPR